jgi:hypothetical protein
VNQLYQSLLSSTRTHIQTLQNVPGHVTFQHIAAPGGLDDTAVIRMRGITLRRSVPWNFTGPSTLTRNIKVLLQLRDVGLKVSDNDNRNQS